MSGSPLRPNNNQSGIQYGTETRWPRKRGGYEIEKQCSVCRWFFDSFDPERKLCSSCLEANLQPPPVDASLPDSTVQQGEVPQAFPNPLQSFGMPGAENTPLGYQTYGTTFDPACPQGTLPNLSGGYNMPGSMWTQDYNMPLISSDFTGGYTQDQTFGQGYLTSPDPSFYSQAMPSPNQQAYNMLIDPSSSFGAPPFPTAGYTQNQNYYQGDNPTQHSSEPETTVPPPKPLRPLLPRDKNAPPPPESDDDSRFQGSRSYRAWLKSQPGYRGAVETGESSSKGKSKGKKKK